MSHSPAVRLTALLTLTIALGCASPTPPTASGHVHVNGHEMFVDCRGDGDVTVWMEAGAGASSLRFRPVQETLVDDGNANLRVCVSDRAGFGWSAPGPLPRTPDVLVDDIEVLFDRLDVDGPVVWVGHSLGGLLGRHLQHRQPGRLQALVLVDSAHEGQWAVFPDAYNQFVENSLEQMALLPTVATLGLWPAMRPLTPQPPFPADLLDEHEATSSSASFFEASHSEIHGGYHADWDTLGLDDDIGDLPLAVVSAGRSSHAFAGAVPDGFPHDEADAVWLELQADLTAMSTTSAQWIVDDATHEILLEHPDVIVDAVRWAVDAL